MARTVHRPSGTNAGKPLPRKASGSGLGKIGNYETPRKPLPLYGRGDSERARARRDFSHFMLSGVQKVLFFGGGVDVALAKCCRGLTYEAQHVEVRVFEDGRSGLTHLAHCGNPLCPVCGPRLASKRLETAQKAASYLLEQGCSYLFVTFTASHGRTDSLADLRERMGEAREGFFRSYLVKRLRKQGFLSDTIRAFEITEDHPTTPEDKRTGWHPHWHEVWFCKHGIWLTDEEVAELQQELVEEWKAQLQAVGLTCSGERGVVVESVQDWTKKHWRDRTGRAADFCGMTPDERGKHLGRIVGYLTKSMGFELTNTGRKVSRRGLHGGARVSSWNLTELAVRLDGDAGEQARRRYVEMVKGCRGVHWFTLSRGLAERAGIKDAEKLEGDAPELMRMDDDHGIVLAKVRADDVRPVMRQGRLGHLASIAAGEIPADSGSLSWGGSVKAACRAAAQGIDILTGDRLTGAGVVEWNGPAATPYLRVSQWLQNRQAGMAETQARRREREEAARRVGTARGRLYGGSLRDVDLLPRLLARAADHRRGGVATMSPGQLRRIEWVFRLACWGEAAGMSERVPAACEWSPTREQVRLPGL